MKSKRDGSLFWTILCILLIILLGFRFYSIYTYAKIDVSGNSMMQTLQDGDKLLVNKRQKAKRGDIIVIDVDPYRETHLFNDSTDYIIKRLIGTEGDTLYCSDNTVYIQYSGTEGFVALEEEYVSSPTPDFQKITVGEGEIFFLGDNRAISKDSTEVGCFRSDDIYGVLVPFSLTHNWVLMFF